MDLNYWLPVVWFGVIGFGVLMYVVLDASYWGWACWHRLRATSRKWT